MEPFDQVARRYLALQGVLFRAVEEDDKPVIMNLIQRIQTICDDTTTLLSDRKEELVREQRMALEETQTRLDIELEKLQGLQAREESLREAQEKLDQEKEGLVERERAVEQGNHALNQSNQAFSQSKDQFLANLEHWAKEEKNRDKKRSLLEQDLDKKRSLLQQDLDQIKNDQARIIKDQAKVTQMQRKVIEDQTKVMDEQATLREKEQRFLRAQEKAKDDHANFKLQVEQRANDKCEEFRRELDKKEERMNEQHSQTIRDTKEKAKAYYEKQFTHRINKKEADLDAEYNGRKRQLESEYTRRKQELETEHARRSEELDKEKQDTIATRDSLKNSIEAIKIIDGSLNTLSLQQPGQPEVVETLLSGQGQEGDSTTALHHTRDTAARYFSQLDSATQSLEEERGRHEATRAALTSASSNLTAADNRITGLQGEKAALEARLRTAEDNIKQQATALEEKRKENQKDKTSLMVLRSNQLQEARRKRARDEADNGPTFWRRAMKDAKEALELFYVANSCSMNANDLIPRLWDILDNGSMYKRLLGFHNNAQPCNWRCLRTLVTKGSFVAKPLTDAGCPFHPSEEKCLQVRIIEEEEGGRVMDFRMA